MESNGEDRTRRDHDVRRILWAQAARAFAYGFAALLLGTTLYRIGLSGFQAGAVLAAVAAGSVLSSVAVARAGDRVGRRRMYLFLCLLLGASGLIFAYAANWWIFAIAALTGTLSTEVIASGPFASLDHAMLAGEPDRARRLRVFGRYDAVAAAAGSLGALAVGAPDLLRRTWPMVPPDQRFFLVLVAAAGAGALVAARLSPGVELGGPSAADGAGQSKLPQGLSSSRRIVAGLAPLFALDSFAGGFVLQAFLAYWFAARFGASPSELGVMFFGVGVAQTGSVLIAARLGSRFGLLPTMVVSHLPSNLLLAAVPLAPTFLGAAGLLVARSTLSQMDVPTRQAYLMAMVDPAERTAAVGYTNAARYATRPAGPLLAGAGVVVLPGLPFFVAGGLKTLYDLLLWTFFHNVPFAEGRALPPKLEGTGPEAGGSGMPESWADSSRCAPVAAEEGPSGHLGSAEQPAAPASTTTEVERT
ncbi:MAG TPA: hypothetical protein VMV23_08515 [Candidatus Nanopelagicaceae bacterium]|nr:hypothetical protein [Candidatus Nanopelagicaceae bacterium]